MDARGARLFVGYHKVSNSQLVIDGKDCEAFSFQFTDARQSENALFAPVPLQSWMILIPTQRGLLLFNFVTSSPLFDSEQPTFNKIIASYHSTAVAPAAP